MQPWPSLSEFLPEAWHPQELEAAREKLNERIRALMKQRETFDRYRDQLQAASVKTVQADHVFQADANQHNEFVILQAEDKVREAIEVYLHQWQQARRVELERASQAHVQAEKNLRNQLVRIGYVDTPDATVPGRIQPLFLMTHPTVRKAKSYVQELQNEHPQLSEANRKAWQQVTERMELLKRRAIAG